MRHDGVDVAYKTNISILYFPINFKRITSIIELIHKERKAYNTGVQVAFNPNMSSFYTHFDADCKSLSFQQFSNGFILKLKGLSTESNNDIVGGHSDVNERSRLCGCVMRDLPFKCVRFSAHAC